MIFTATLTARLPSNAWPFLQLLAAITRSRLSFETVVEAAAFLVSLSLDSSELDSRRMTCVQHIRHISLSICVW